MMHTKDGHTITVDAGICTENVDVYKSLTIESTSENSANTIVQAKNPNDPVFDVTVDYVNISGFTVEGATENSKAGIYLFDVEHCVITDNNVTDNYYGIHLNYSSNNSIANNTLLYNDCFGICIYGSNDNFIVDNVAQNNDGWSIYMEDSINNNIVNNTVQNNGAGIYLLSSKNSILSNNNVLNNSGGIHLGFSNNCTLTNNIMLGNKRDSFDVHGWTLSDYIHNIDTSNKIDEKPIYYWVNKRNKEISSDAGYIGIVSSTNITVKNVTLANVGKGILFAYTTRSKIENVNVSDNGEGIILISSNNNILINNNASNNVRGIYLYSSINNSISNNICSNNRDGIYFEDSSNNRSKGNVMTENGIYIEGGSLSDYTHEIDTSNTVNGKPVYYWKDVERGKVPDGAGQVILVNCKDIVVENRILNEVGVGLKVVFSSSITLKNNNCSSNNRNGIYLGYSDDNSITNNKVSNNVDGISLYSSSNNTVIYNNANSNNYIGIRLFDSSTNNTLTNNNVSNNYHSIALWSSSKNNLYLNNFINNSQNVHSFSSTSIWNSTSPITYTYNGNTYTNYLGNYWDDYTDIDTNNDGIWDNFYPIDSDNDYHPLVDPFETYITPLSPEKSLPVPFFSQRDPAGKQKNWTTALIPLAVTAAHSHLLRCSQTILDTILTLTD